MRRRHVLEPRVELKPRGRWIQMGSFSLAWTKVELKSMEMVVQSRIRERMRRTQTEGQVTTGA